MKLISIHGVESCSNHNAGIALFEDGICTVCMPVERLSRNKLAINEPVNLDIIKKVLNYRNLTIDDIDIWLIPVSFDWQRYSLPQDKIVITNEENHHLAHIARSFYTSTFDHACCLCINGLGGKNEAITLAYATREKGIKVLKTFPFTHSLGIYYETASDLITGRSSESKFMALSAYGTKLGNKPIDFNKEMLETSISEVAEHWHKYWQDNYAIKDRINFASAVQDDLNKNVLELVKLIKEYYPEEENLCLSGGTFLNSTTNMILDESGLFRNIYCSPHPHDEGQAIGKGLYYLEEELHQKTSCKDLTPYLGFDYDIDEIYDYINKDAVIIEKYSEERIINTLKSNGIIAWYQGRSEIGVRALGHRSLFASSHNKSIIDKLSRKVKQREDYRPLASICIDELYTMAFSDSNPDNLTRYMLKTVKVKEAWKDKISAVIHVNNTAFPQVLKKEDSPRLYRLIKQYYEETGIPCLAHTSLNLKGDPIVETPKDLIDFLRKNPLVDYCVFNGQYIITVKDKECI